jgi:hypothetical protein
LPAGKDRPAGSGQIPSDSDRIPEVTMSDQTSAPSPPPEIPPLGQRLFDRPFLLLGAGLVVMFLFYTGWGMWEILSLPAGTLP